MNVTPSHQRHQSFAKICLTLWALLILGAEVQAQTGTSLIVQPQQLVFNAVAGQACTNVQRLHVVWNAAAASAWTSVSTKSWLKQSAANGIAPGGLDISVDAFDPTVLVPGVYQGQITVTFANAPASPQSATVVLIVNPSTGARVARWKDGHKGACSVSVDDSLPAGYETLQQLGLKGTYYLNGGEAPDFFSGFYQSGMEMGAHLFYHTCAEVDETTLRDNIVPNVQGITYSTQTPLDSLTSLAWPCGVSNLVELVVASEYFLSARGYGSDLMEESTPYDFMYLKNYDSKEHGRDQNLKDVVDAAEAEHRWANLVFHAELNDEGSVEYTLSKDVWVAPIGTVIKYIHQRDRTIISGYTESDSTIEFNVRRLSLDLPRRYVGNASPTTTFETALTTEDLVSIELALPDTAAGVLQVLVDGEDQAYSIRTEGNQRKLILNLLAKTTDRSVMVLISDETTPVLGPLPANLVFAAFENTDPSDQTLQIKNTGSGSMEWTAEVATPTATWLDVNPKQGIGNGNVTVSVNTANLLPGTYAATILVESIGTANSPQPVEVSLTLVEAGTKHFDFNYRDRATLLAPATGWSFTGRIPNAAGTGTNPRNTEADAVLSPQLVVSYDQTAHPGTLVVPAAAGQLWQLDNNSVNTLFRELPPTWKSVRLKASYHPAPVYVDNYGALFYHQIGLMAYRDDDNYAGVNRILNPTRPPTSSDVGYQTFYAYNQVEILNEATALPNIVESVPFPATSFYLRLDRVDADTLSGLYSVDGETWLNVPIEIDHNLEGGGLLQPLLLAVVVGGSYPFEPAPPFELHWVEVIDPPAVQTITVTSIDPTSGAHIRLSRLDQNGNGDGDTTFTRSYPNGTELKLTADPVPQRNFQEWRKDGVAIGSTPTVKVTISGNHTLTAVYTPIQQNPLQKLTVKSTPVNGVQIGLVAGANGAVGSGTTEFTLPYAYGTEVTLTAPPTAFDRAFQSWQDSSGQVITTDSTTKVVMTRDITLVAAYAPAPETQLLTIESQNPDEGVRMGVSPADNNHADEGTTKFTRTYNRGTLVTLTAPTTASGNTFQKWQRDGADFSASPTVQVSMDADHSLKAIYVTPSLATLTVNSANPNAWVLITVTPGDNNGNRSGLTPFSRSFKTGTTVTLSAFQNYFGRAFQKWQKDGADFSVNPSVQVTMDRSYTLTAVYGAAPVVKTLTIESTNPNSGVAVTLSPADNNGKTKGDTRLTLPYNQGTAVTVTAPATVQGNSFQKWQKDGKDFGTSTAVTVTMDNDHRLTAVYISPPTRTVTVASSNPNSGVAIGVSLADDSGKRDGSTTFTRAYKQGTVVTFTAPATAGGNNFQKWQRDGTDIGSNQAIQITIDGNFTLRAVYVKPQTLWTLTVASSNPNSGVAVTVSPTDNNGKRDGTTKFSRTYKTGTAVTLKAPAKANGKNFQKWQKDGVDAGTSVSIQVTMNANHTLTAVYVDPPIVRSLTVASANPASGVSITVTPADNNQKSDGSTKFNRSYNNGTVVTLKAPASVSGKTFQKWQKNGADFNTSQTVQVTMNGDYTLTAVYVSPTVVRTLTVNSVNPASGVAIGVSPADNSSAANGTTSFARSYNNGKVVSLSAPTTAGGNNFQKWQRNGTDYTTSANTTVTMDASYTMTAVYVTPPPVVRTLTINSSNPNTGVSISVTPTDNNNAGGGPAPFVRSYNHGKVVSLTAPATAGGNNFQKWQRNGTDYSTSANTTVTMDASYFMTAIYVTPPSTRRTLTINSVNPTSGVGILMAPDDINGLGGGYTSFTRIYEVGDYVGLMAPSKADGNSFKKWQKNGVDYSTSTILVIRVDETSTVTAVYSAPSTPVLPSSWATQDIGTTGVAGTASYDGSTFTVVGSGADIWNNADEFRYVYQTATGDCSIIARVKSVQNTDPWAKAGIMIRDSLNANAKHAAVFVTPGNGVAFQSRNSSGGSSANTNTTGLSAPYWIKLVRSGSTFTAYRSSNGTSWTNMGSQSISMGSSVSIGLAVTSHKDGTLCTSAVDNVTVSK
ncbi:MAG: InlB B-repeat-containing protein [Verrucomicrobiota bacterium]